MLTIALPYRTGNPEQVPVDYLISKGFRIEANIFDINQLEGNSAIAELTAELEAIQSRKKDIVGALHFPTDNADYLNNAKKADALFAAIDICSNLSIPILVLHSNAIVSIETYQKSALPEMRKKYIQFYKKIDAYLDRIPNPPTVCIENMPVIGNTGMDFDSPFVFPTDFTDFVKFKRIAIAWDLCHWAFTVLLSETFPDKYPAFFEFQKIDFSDFLKNDLNIRHWHFGSFGNLTFPFANQDCNEGATPDAGIFSEALLTDALLKISDIGEQHLLTLEIKETDYKERRNFKLTVDWIEKILHVPCPEK